MHRYVSIGDFVTLYHLRHGNRPGAGGDNSKTEMKRVTYREDVKAKSQNLRRNMTKEERHLWYDFLKGYQPAFHRQKPIGIYVADFYCAAAKLVIEIDGGQHYEDAGKDYDVERTKFLQNLGIEVLRFSNRDVW